MVAFIYLAGAAAVLGGVIGWLTPQNRRSLLMRSAAVAFGFAFALLALNGPPESWNPRYILTAIPYFVLPFVIFILAPTMVGAVTGHLARRRRSG